MLKVPGPIGWPFIGIAHKIKQREKENNLLPIGDEFFKKYGSTFLAWLGPTPFILTADPQVVQDILTSPHCINKSPEIYILLKELFGNGLGTSKGATWMQHRRILNSAFKHNVINSFLPTFNSETKSLLQTMDSYVGQGGKNLFRPLKKVTLGTSIQSLMGVNAKNEDCIKNNNLLESYERALEIGHILIYQPLYRRFWKKEYQFTQIKTKIRNTYEKIVQMNLETSISSNDENIFINQAMKHLKMGNLSYQDVVDECSSVTFAGFESTYTTIGNTLMLLAMFPHFQEKVYEELREIFPNTGDFDVTHGDLQKMDYLQRVLNESMRLFPVLPIIARRTDQDVQLLNGIIVPKFTNVAIGIFHMHRSKDIWGPEANTFNPDHFLPHNIKEKHSYAYIPFAKGSRNCIGWSYALMFSKLTLAKLLRNYKFHTDFRFENLKPIHSVSLKFNEVPLLELERRY
ncbi:probable cytochrome P450 313a4 [Drosophila willistoni]|uniref:probable cytochrome P450 313a4 n=1 Tax=Drosophila willistoni TaxID=7260 RepID=UPI000C26C4E1|nr:probable cytochrome P450 313a4 [Drosophila willistoni]